MNAATYRAQAMAQASNMAPSERTLAISSLLADLKAERDVGPNLQALKMLGRIQSGSAQLAMVEGMEILLGYALASDPSEAQLDGWRVVCNTLKLHDHAARTSLQAIDTALPGIVSFMLPTVSPALQFLASRALFLLTATGAETNRTLIEHHHLLPYLYQLLSWYSPDVAVHLSAEQSMALAEHLKVVYNLAIFYPRLQAIDPKPADSPSSSAPSILSTDATEKNSLGSTALGRVRSVFSKMPSPSNVSRPGSPRNQLHCKSKLLKTIKSLDQLALPILQLTLSLPFSPRDPTPQPPLSHAIHSLSELLCTGEWFDTFDTIHQSIVLNHLSPPTTSTLPTAPEEDLPPLAGRLLVLLDACLATCFPDRVAPDDEANLKRIAQLTNSEISAVDSELTPLLLLIRKCIVNDESGQCGRGLRARLLSDSMDRTQSLDRRADLTGRLARLMTSVYFSHTKVGAGELLFALCRQDPDDFAQTIGYGLASGFLASNGLLVPPPSRFSPPQGSSSNTSRPVDPITGAFVDPNAPKEDPMAGMSEEEKLLEAERLFVLFDRMAKTGVMSVENPVRKAQETGRLSELDQKHEQEEIQQQQAEEDEDERQAAAEMQKWKARNKRPQGL